MSRFMIALALVAAVSCSELEPLPPRQELPGDVGGGQGVGGGPATSSVASTTSAGGAACDDAHEPNDNETRAVDLGALSGCGGGSSVDGALAGASDVDWFVYSGDDAAGCIAPLRAITADGGLRLCKYAACTSGNTTVTCQDGATAALSPAGRDGCCHTQGFAMTIACTGAEDDATVYLSVDQAALACVTYTLSFQY